MSTAGAMIRRAPSRTHRFIRGRSDRAHARPGTPKAVYLYELRARWRERLGVPAPEPTPLGAGEGLDASAWAANEFGGAPLGDARLSARLVQSAHLMAQSPMRAITGAARGARALIKGHYRLIDRPADSAVTVPNILAPHRQRTPRRLRPHDTVLCVQDTTVLNFTRRAGTEGLGVIGSNQTGAHARGLHLHATLALDPDGVPLGLLRADFRAPPPVVRHGPLGRLPRPVPRTARTRPGVDLLVRAKAERLQRAAAINMVIAWRIQLMLRLGREVPELPAEVLFDDTELRVLAAFARSQRLPKPQHLGDAVKILARLGGWTGRTGRSRDPPGAQLLWHGYTQFAPMTFALQLNDQYG